MIQIVLHEPEIPFNTGAIGRSCVATDSALHLIEPLGFVLNDKYVKRAGMDYWDKLELHRYVDYEDFLQKHPEIVFAGEEGKENETFPEEYFPGSTPEEAAVAKTDVKGGGNRQKAGKGSRPHLWFATTKARQCYSDVSYGPDDFIMFGKESAGIPEEILVQHPKACIRIPMWGDIRSLNLSNSAAVILYEALRQNGFENLSRKGNLHRLSWEQESKVESDIHMSLSNRCT